MCVVSGCRVYVQTTLSDLYLGGGTDSHCHAPNPELIEVKQVRHQMKERALNEMSSVGMIYDEENRENHHEFNSSSYLPDEHRNL